MFSLENIRSTELCPSYCSRSPRVFQRLSVRLQRPNVLLFVSLGRHHCHTGPGGPRLGLRTQTGVSFPISFLPFKQFVQQVSRSSKQFLKIMQRKPVLLIEALNPHLFSLLQELRAVKVIGWNINSRHQWSRLLVIGAEAGAALDQTVSADLQGGDGKAAARLAEALRALSGLAGRLQCPGPGRPGQGRAGGAPEMCLAGVQEAHSRGVWSGARSFSTDFRLVFLTGRSFQSCSGKGFICETCKDKTVLFPFDDFVISCRKCQTVFHRF